MITDLDSSISVLIDALNQVAKVHPIIESALDLVSPPQPCNVFTASKGIVGVFSTAYKLENTRKENDRKVELLYAEVRDMMDVLLRYGQHCNLSFSPS